MNNLLKFYPQLLYDTDLIYIRISINISKIPLVVVKLLKKKNKSNINKDIHRYTAIIRSSGKNTFFSRLEDSLRLIYPGSSFLIPDRKAQQRVFYTYVIRQHMQSLV